MFDHNRLRPGTRAMVGAAVAVWLACADLQAQSAAEYRARIERMAASAKAAKAAADSAETARRRVAKTMTIEAGPVRIIADSAVVEHVTPLASRLEADFGATFGIAAQALSGHPLRVRHSIVVSPQGDTTGKMFISLAEHSWTESEMTMRDDSIAREQNVAAASGRLVQILHDSLDEDLADWFRAPLPSTPETAGEAQATYIHLVTLPSVVARGCVEGDIAACRYALGLDSIPDVVMMALSPYVRWEVVAGNPRTFRTPDAFPEYDRCARAREDAACVARLRTMPVEYVLDRISDPYVRRSFAQFVLATGAPGAYDRLRESRDWPIRERIARAGRGPLDSLVTGWRDHIMAARPPRVAMTPEMAGLTILWILCCGALSLRSSRWR